ncbi:hypothetical protein [Aquipuribacter sp. MA13-6]|uniref:hypothetical protein n=1 Tax=unclassified Aquipuribacter TaxID=2635084 RepID=UPI003EF0396D
MQTLTNSGQTKASDAMAASPQTASLLCDFEVTGVDAATWAAAASAVAAALALLANAVQLRYQNKINRMQQLDTADAMWRRWHSGSQVGSVHNGVDVEQLEPLIANACRRMAERTGRQFVTVSRRFPEPTRETPWAMEVFIPEIVGQGPPVTEAEYKTRMHARSVLVGEMLSSIEQAPAYRQFELGMRNYLNHLNDVAERLDTGVVDRLAFMSKYSPNIIRAAYHYEPYILWFNYAHDDAYRYMRLLRLSAAARIFYWLSPFQQTRLYDRSEYGPILAPRTGFQLRGRVPILMRWSLGRALGKRTRSRHISEILGLRRRFMPSQRFATPYLRSQISCLES